MYKYRKKLKILIILYLNRDIIMNKMHINFYSLDIDM